jgi:hypothetical protein
MVAEFLTLQTQTTSLPPPSRLRINAPLVVGQSVLGEVVVVLEVVLVVGYNAQLVQHFIGAGEAPQVNAQEKPHSPSLDKLTR